MRLIKINDQYIEYLSKIEPKVFFNKGEKRPYVGICFEIDGHLFFAPLTSPKLKHKHMKSSIDFYKIKDGKLGYINLNNMIPVYKNEIIEFDIKQEENFYLYKAQLEHINKNKQIILLNAKKLYFHIITKEKTYLHKRCCNFKLLEEAKEAYIKLMNDGKETF